MQGEISVAYQYGKVKKFTVVLTLATNTKTNNYIEPAFFRKKTKTVKDGNTAVSANSKPIDNSIKKPLLDNSTKIVLIVDDSPINCFIISEMLHRYSVNSEKALNGKQALDMIKEKNRYVPYSLILMDINMSIMSGPEVIHEIFIGNY